MPDYIIKIKEKLDMDNTLDVAVFACLMTCFYTAGRVREFMVKQLDSFNINTHITLARLREEVDQNSLQVTVLQIPCTKTSPDSEE